MEFAQNSCGQTISLQVSTGMKCSGRYCANVRLIQMSVFVDAATAEYLAMVCPWLGRLGAWLVHADRNQDSQERFVHRTQVVQVVLVPNPQGLVAWYEMFGAFWDIIVILCHYVIICITTWCCCAERVTIELPLLSFASISLPWIQVDNGKSGISNFQPLRKSDWISDNTGHRWFWNKGNAASDQVGLWMVWNFSIPENHSGPIPCSNRWQIVPVAWRWAISNAMGGVVSSWFESSFL